MALLRSVVEAYSIGLIKDGGPFAMCLPCLPKGCRTYCVAFVIRSRSEPRRTDQRWRPIRNVFASAPKVLQNLTYHAAFEIRGRSVPRRTDQRLRHIRLGSQSSAELTVSLLRSVLEMYRIGLIKDGNHFAMCPPRLLKFCKLLTVALLRSIVEVYRV